MRKIFLHEIIAIYKTKKKNIFTIDELPTIKCIKNRRTSQNLDFWQMASLPIKVIFCEIIYTSDCLKNRNDYQKFHSWKFRSVQPFRTSFPHRLWKQRFEKNTFKVLRADDTQLQIFIFLKLDICRIKKFKSLKIYEFLICMQNKKIFWNLQVVITP